MNASHFLPQQPELTPEIRIVRAYTPLLTQEEEFSQADAIRKEAEDAQGREEEAGETYSTGSSRRQVKKPKTADD